MPLIAFTSPKGGVGKTTLEHHPTNRNHQSDKDAGQNKQLEHFCAPISTENALAAHTAAILRGRGYRVLAIDLDPQNALRLHLGAAMLTPNETGFMARIDQGVTWREATIRTPSSVDLLPFGATEARRAMELACLLYATPDLLAAPVRGMLAVPGLIVLLDTPPGLTPAIEALLPLLDLICLVLLADAGSAAMMPAVVSGQVFGRGTLASRFTSRMGVVMNQVDFDQKLNAAVMDCATAALGPRLLAVVCRDDALAEALADKRLLTAGGPGAADDLQILVDQIVGRLHLPPLVGDGGYSALSEWGLR